MRFISTFLKSAYEFYFNITINTYLCSQILDTKTDISTTRLVTAKINTFKEKRTSD